jgi:hypothetical protein
LTRSISSETSPTRASRLGSGASELPPKGMTTPIKSPSFSCFLVQNRGKGPQSASVTGCREFECWLRVHLRAEMVELLRTNDIVYLSFVRHMLNEEGIDHLLLDEYVSAVEGSINAIPRRIVVAENMLKSAQILLSNHSLTINQ